jgi:H+/gluconate symporter-like permease
MEDAIKTVCTILGAPICTFFWWIISSSFQKTLVKDTGWKWLKYPFMIADGAYAGLCGYAFATELTRLGLFIAAH